MFSELLSEELYDCQGGVAWWLIPVGIVVTTFILGQIGGCNEALLEDRRNAPTPVPTPTPTPIPAPSV